MALSRIPLVFLVLSVFSVYLHADWVQVTGKAVYDEDRYDYVRQQAREDALQQAVMSLGGRVESIQRVENGLISQDSFSLSNDASVNEAVLEDEYIEGGILNLVMSVDVEAVPTCPSSQANAYKKKVAVMGFALQSPQQAKMGRLDNIERGLASALNSALHQQDNLVVFEHSQFGLHQETTNAPTRFTAQRTLTKATNYAQQIGAQFVVSGVVRDLGVENTESFSTSYWNKLKRLTQQVNMNRRFTTEIFVHDGFSGAIVWQKRFSTSAPWTDELGRDIGFGSSEFWQGEYGQAVSAVVDDMAWMIGDQLRCQPFMTRISRVDGKTLHFTSGASSGLRPGDKLSVYRTYNYYDSDLLKGTELMNAKTALTVSQVHPNFSSGSIAVDPGRLNIQEDDLLVAW
jgi:hypothetical protein